MLKTQRPWSEAVSHRTTHRLLKRRRPSLLHAIDPFKVPLDQAIAKARAIQALDFPALILASTDWNEFDATIHPYVEAIRSAAPDLPILLHFPPRSGYGMPMVAGADATMYPFLLGSTDPYFVWRSYAETAERLQLDPSRSNPPEILHLAALTFGEDQRSRDVMALEPIDARIDRLVDMVHLMGLQGAYLFSRHEKVPPSVCRRFRERMAEDHLLFVSGGVREPQRASDFFAAGADFVVFCGALECDNWRPVLEDLAAGTIVERICP